MTLTSRLSRSAVVAVVSLLALSVPVTSAIAATVPVNPGPALSAGKVIVGTGQNLPSLDVTAAWNIGSYAAPQVNAYYTSGRAASDQESVAKAALNWTRSWVAKTCGSLKPAKVKACKAAAVFDIDETLLSNYEWISTLADPFTYDSAASTAANANCTTPPIKATVALFNAYKRLGVTPFLITGRSEASRGVTEACLAQTGITGYSALILAPTGSTQNAGDRKADQRQVLVSQGWKIGPSIGDQVSDMSHGSLGRGFLMPNAMYFLP